jgi:hypothetical protein
MGRAEKKKLWKDEYAASIAPKLRQPFAKRKAALLIRCVRVRCVRVRCVRVRVRWIWLTVRAQSQGEVERRAGPGRRRQPPRSRVGFAS